MMGLKRQIERLRHWACPQVYYCDDCKYAIHNDWNGYADGYDTWCPFENVIRAAEDRAKEVRDNDTEAYKKCKAVFDEMERRNKPEPYKCHDCIAFPCLRKECDKNHEAKACKYFELW